MSVFLPMAALLGGGSALDVADVFSTDLWTGDGSTRDITNGIDLSAEGGLTWIKSRSAGNPNALFDTVRGATKPLRSDTSGAELTEPTTLTGFNSDGFSLSSDSLVNAVSQTYVGWSFRRAPKFFDVVTYTGNGSTQNIAHSLGQVPGLITVKRTDGSGNWRVYHRSTGQGQSAYLNLTNAFAADTTTWNNTAPTDSQFTVGAEGDVNGTSQTYVAYLFAHDTSDSGIIQCGSYNGNGGSFGPTVPLPWLPQYLLIKRADGIDAWYCFDNQRSTGATWDDSLRPNGANAEVVGSALIRVGVASTYFQPASSDTSVNASGDTYIYMAIRAEGA